MKPGVDYVGVTTSFICHDGNGNVLLGKRSQNTRDEQGTWEFGGGKLEVGLTLEQNVLKEIREEYGCDAVIEKELPPITLFRRNGDEKTHWITVPYIVRVDPLHAKNNEPESIDEIGWFPIGNFPTPFHSGANVILETHKEYIKKYLV